MDYKLVQAKPHLNRLKAIYFDKMQFFFDFNEFLRLLAT